MQPDPKERLVDPETGETPPLSPQSFSNTLSVASKPSAATIRKTIELFDALSTAKRQPDRRIVPTDEWEDYERHLAAHLEPDDAA